MASATTRSPQIHFAAEKAVADLDRTRNASPDGVPNEHSRFKLDYKTPIREFRRGTEAAWNAGTALIDAEIIPGDRRLSRHEVSECRRSQPFLL